MNAQTHSITTWVQLAGVLLLACEWSDPKTAEPVGTATFERISNGIVHLSMNLDLIPMAAPVIEAAEPF